MTYYVFLESCCAVSGPDGRVLPAAGDGALERDGWDHVRHSSRRLERTFIGYGMTTQFKLEEKKAF